MRATACIALAAAGCGGAGLLLKSPIEDRCVDAGLRGCSEIAEGAILFIEGDKQGGTRKVVRGGAANSPGEIKRFAAALKTIESIPGASEYMGPISELVDILIADAARAEAMIKKPKPAKDVEPTEPTEGADDDAPKARKSVERAGDAQPIRVITAEHDPARVELGFVAPALATDHFACGSSGTCVRATVGPLFVTDIRGSDGCPVEMFAAAGAVSGELSNSAWTVSVRPSIHGARLFVQSNEALFLGVAAGRGSTDARCSIAWSGFRPYEQP